MCCNVAKPLPGVQIMGPPTDWVKKYHDLTSRLAQLRKQPKKNAEEIERVNAEKQEHLSCLASWEEAFRRPGSTRVRSYSQSRDARAGDPQHTWAGTWKSRRWGAGGRPSSTHQGWHTYAPCTLLGLSLFGLTLVQVSSHIGSGSGNRFQPETSK